MAIPAFDPEARHNESLTPDYTDFCLLRDAALSIGDRASVLPNDKWHNISFNAVNVQTDLVDPAYAPMCRDVEVGWKKYGRKENLSIRLSESALGTNTSDQAFVQLFGITTKNDSVVYTWQSTYYPKLKDDDIPEGPEKTSDIIESIVGSVLIEDILDKDQPVTRYDCWQLESELLQFRDEE